MGTIEQLISEQVMRWAQRERAFAPRGHQYWPVITVSREFGALGAALARELGERLDFRVWDTDLVHAIAHDAGGDVAMMASLDERRRRVIEDMIRGAIRPTDSNIQYVRALMRVVHTIKAHGHAIIVGRGANYVDKTAQMLRVRVVCPLSLRVQRYAETHDLTSADAERYIVERDAERADFILHTFHRDVSDPADYDLILNAGIYTIAQMADLVIAAYEMKVGRDVPVVEGA